MKLKEEDVYLPPSTSLLSVRSEQVMESCVSVRRKELKS